MGYLRRVMREAKRRANAGEIGARVVTVAHDNWCNILNGRGPCNCNPDIKYGNTQ